MRCFSLVLTLTVTTRWASISLTWTVSGRAMATYLPMNSLSLRQFLQVPYGLTLPVDQDPCAVSCVLFINLPRTPSPLSGRSHAGVSFLFATCSTDGWLLFARQVVLDIAQRAARAAGRAPPRELPLAWSHLHALLGGNPRLLSLAVVRVGSATAFTQGDTWTTGAISTHSRLVTLILLC